MKQRKSSRPRSNAYSNIFSWIASAVFLTCFLFSFSLQAQNDATTTEESKGRFNAGIKVGVSTTQISGDGYSGFDKAGFLAGFLVNTPISEKLTGQFEMLFIQKGSRNPIDPDAGKLDSYQINLNYVEVPLLLKFSYKKFLFELGPSIGILISEREFDENGNVNASIFDFKPTDTGLNLGANFAINRSFHLNVRGFHSVLPIANTIEVTRFGPRGGSYNQTLSFALHYQFLK